MFELADDEIEMGVGIHGEPGRERQKIASADAIADALLDAVVADLSYSAGDQVALMVNGLAGGPFTDVTSCTAGHQRLAEQGVAVNHHDVNKRCTSLDMAGDSLTLVKLDEKIDALLGAPAGVAIRVYWTVRITHNTAVRQGSRAPSSPEDTWPGRSHSRKPTRSSRLARRRHNPSGSP